MVNPFNPEADRVQLSGVNTPAPIADTTGQSQLGALQGALGLTGQAIALNSALEQRQQEEAVQGLVGQAAGPDSVLPENFAASQTSGTLNDLITARETGVISATEFKSRAKALVKRAVADNPDQREALIAQYDRFLGGSKARAATAINLSPEEEGVIAARKEIAKQSALLGVTPNAYIELSQQERQREIELQNLSIRAKKAQFTTDSVSLLSRTAFEEDTMSFQTNMLAAINQSPTQSLDPSTKAQLRRQAVAQLNTRARSMRLELQKAAQETGVPVNRAAVEAMDANYQASIRSIDTLLEGNDTEALLKSSASILQSNVTLVAGETFPELMLLNNIDSSFTTAYLEYAQAIGNNDQLKLKALRANPATNRIVNGLTGKDISKMVLQGTVSLSGGTPSQTASNDAEEQDRMMVALTTPLAGKALQKGLRSSEKQRVTTNLSKIVSETPEALSVFSRPELFNSVSDTPATLEALDKAAISFANSIKYKNGVQRGDFNNALDLKLDTTQSSVGSEIGLLAGGVRSTETLNISGADATPYMQAQVQRLYRIMKAYPLMWKRIGVDNPLDAVKHYMNLPITTTQ